MSPLHIQKKTKMVETQARTIVKTICYRIATIVQGFVIAYGLTGSFIESVKFTIWTNAIGVVVYYIWERLWNRIKWGRYAEEDVHNERASRLG